MGVSSVARTGGFGNVALVGAANSGLTAAGELYALAGDTIYASIRGLVKRTFPWREAIEQAWFIASVCILPSILVAIPFGVLVAVEVGSVAHQIGADSYTGAVDALTIVREAAPLVTALMIAGVGGSAICADLGARKIRDEIDALEVMGISPLERLVAPRLMAAIIVTILLNGVVLFVGVAGGYIYEVWVGHGTAGSFLRTFTEFTNFNDIIVGEIKAAVFGVIAALVAGYKGLSVKGGPKGVGDAVNQSVVISFLLVFVANTVISQIYILLIPPKGP
jgi:phospholipid/cholesterol/gamma-HCH transport system permease protein